MPDVFISYSSRDRAFIVPIVEYLTERGLDVWWDRQINAGNAYAKDIENALDSAKSVVVVWSRHSVQSDWVRAEAGEGHSRGILVPLNIDGTRPPLIFRALHQLSHRLGNESDLDALLAVLIDLSPRFAQKLVKVEPRVTGSQTVNKHWSTPPFIGRGHLLQNLDDAMSLAGGGAGQVVLLSGESGMGKSRTAQEFAERARLKGVVVYATWAEENMYAPLLAAYPTSQDNHGAV